jgi:DNA-binding GntR family transcriptional regulator
MVETARGVLFGALVGRDFARPSTPELIASTVREAIVSGSIRPGTQLRQSEVAAEFGVSVIPVREALRQLEAQGFVVLHHNRGAVVPEIALEEIAELFDVRVALEEMLIRAAVPRLTESDLTKAETYSRALDNEADVNRWGHWNWLLHEALYAPANRRRTLAIVGNLHSHIDRVLRLQMSLEGGQAKARREHGAILRACRQHNEVKAAALLVSHIRGVGEIVLRFAAEQVRTNTEREKPVAAASKANGNARSAAGGGKPPANPRPSRKP